MKLRPIINKKGQIQSFIFVIASIFAVGIVLFFLNHMFDAVYTELDEYLETSDYNNTEAHVALQEYQTATNSIWDYAFLGILMGYIILLIVTAFSTRISPVFHWIYILISLIGLLVGVLLSNTWQALAESSEFSTTLTRFPIMNAVLGTYYPTFIMVILMIFLIILFGKPIGET